MIFETLFLLVFSLTSIALILRYAAQLRLIDEPNYRSAHCHPTPRGAGIGFVLAALVDLMLFHPAFLAEHLAVVVALVLVLMVGVLDDRHEAPPRLKFIVLALATLLLYEDGLLIDAVGRYLGREVHLGWLALPFTLFAVVGFSNALNLIDGLDGLAGTISLVILAAFFFLGWRHADPFLMLLSGSFAMGVLVFLFFNWHPASIFMGDSGSLSLGFLISLLAIYALRYIPSVAVLYLGAIPLIDTLVVMIRRKRHGRSATAPDLCHLHHLLLRRWGSVRRTVLFLAGAQTLLAIVGLLLPHAMEQLPALMLFGALVYGVYRLVESMIQSQKIDCYGDSKSGRE